MTKKIAIYNSYPFHYEIFGYIIFYCYLNKYTLDVFTENKYDMGWTAFYQNLFNDYAEKSIFFRYYEEFEDDLIRNNFDLIFLTTDDDPNFKYEWMSRKVICINHYYKCRRIDYFHCLALRPFSENRIKWSLPCIPIVDSSVKVTMVDYHKDTIHVAIIGGGNFDPNSHNTKIINRLRLDDNNKKIVLHIVSRLLTCDLTSINEHIEVRKYSYLETKEMIQILMNCHYLLTDVNNVMLVHTKGHSMSGSIPLSFSCLCQLIISKQNNKYYNFTSALEFDLDTNDDIVLKDIDNNMIQLMNYERNVLIDKFRNHINEIIRINETMSHHDLYVYFLKTRNVL